ncbi:MAG: hypothetical protein M1829_001661 [Trizodia sp. TS-e1964]|nr:MAG: hypothetical protein M1829_001661 [Trizodia sp. TS-e1964]
MANFLINTAGIIASIAVPLAELAKQQHGATTSFTIGIGGASGNYRSFNSEGSVPHVAFWDVNGHRIGQFKGDANGHLDQILDWSQVISNDQTVPRGSPAQPEYISVVAQESDAICISYIYASGNGAQYAWYGDMGWTCGADWHYSNFTVGDGHYQPKCVWIDSDHSNGLRFQGMSLHFPDFTASQTGQRDEYNTNLDALCNSDARMKFWPGIVPDAIIPFFDPPLAYNADGSDADLSLVINKARRRSIASSRPFRRNALPGRQLGAGHLIISNFDSHSAQDLCESESSIGPDFVSMAEGIYCDMAEKEW